jgi:hypothetical protein
MNVLSSHNIFQNDHQNSNNEPVFVEWRPEQIEKFGKEPFIIKHNLSPHPLFQLPRLERLARAIHAAVIEGRAVDAQIKIWRDRPELSGVERMSSWGSKTGVALGKEGWEDELSVLFKDLEEGRAAVSVMLSFSNEASPDYEAILRREVEEVAANTGLSLSDVTFKGMTIIISAPVAVTPYHNDHEQNILFQIQGSKNVYLYDQNDSSILPQAVVENVEIGDGGKAHYREEFSGRETVFHLEPGLAVHHPSLAPHWVKNGDNVSISAAMFFHTRATDDLAHAHQANWFLRRLGLKPPPPDLSKPTDRLKAAIFRQMAGKRNSHASLFRGVRLLKSSVNPARTAFTAVRRRPASA